MILTGQTINTAFIDTNFGQEGKTIEGKKLLLAQAVFKS